jgi:hypothetical protein
MQEPERTPTPAPVENTCYSLSEVESAAAQALGALAAIAPGLSEAELRVAIYLISIQDPQHHTCRASSRQIAEATRVARSNVKRAIDSLTRRSLIATREGNATTTSAYRLNFTQAVTIRGGLTAGPPLQLNLSGVGSQQAHPSEPVFPLDIDKDFDSIIDRTLTARPQHFQRSHLDAVKSYAFKWLTLQRGKANAAPPDDTTCAQILTAAGSLPNAIDWILQHLTDRQAETCMYLVSALLQQLHGIAPPTVKRRRAELRAVTRRGEPAEAAPEPTQQEFPEEMLHQAIAGVKNFR